MGSYDRRSGQRNNVGCRYGWTVTGHQDRKLWAGFSGDRRQLDNVTKQVPKELVLHRVITPDETDDTHYLVLSKPLGHDEFHRLILEKHHYGETYLGIYDLTRQSIGGSSSISTAKRQSSSSPLGSSLPGTKPEDNNHNVYPAFENRARVASHRSS